jgi:polar amino acid transport system substrate-binding protein
MNRKFAVIFVALVLVSAAGCGSGSGNKPDPNVSIVPTIQGGKLIACTDIPYQPFEFGEPGKERGIDVDLVRSIASDLRLKPEFRDTDFSAIFDTMTAGGCDLVASSVSITDERKEKYLFSDGYFEVNQSLLVRAGTASSYTDFAALEGHRIGVQKGTTGADYAAAHSKSLTVIPFDSVDQLFDALDTHQIDGIVQDFPINSYQAQTSNKYRVVKTFTDVAREQYGFALAKSSVELRDAINQSLSKIRKDGRYDEILTRYLGSSTK